MTIAITASGSANAVSAVNPVLTITGMADDTTLTAQQAADVGVLFTTLTAAKDLIFPTAINGKILHVVNASGYAVTIKVAGQTGIAVASAKSAILACSATDFVRVTADA